MNNLFQCKRTIAITEEWQVFWSDASAKLVVTGEPMLTINGETETPQFLILPRSPHGMGWHLLTAAEARTLRCTPPQDTNR